jgi:hypothetical protein
MLTKLGACGELFRTAAGTTERAVHVRVAERVDLADETWRTKQLRAIDPVWTASAVAAEVCHPPPR